MYGKTDRVYAAADRKENRSRPGDYGRAIDHNNFGYLYDTRIFQGCDNDLSFIKQIVLKNRHEKTLYTIFFWFIIILYENIWKGVLKNGIY